MKLLHTIYIAILVTSIYSCESCQKDANKNFGSEVNTSEGEQDEQLSSTTENDSSKQAKKHFSPGELEKKNPTLFKVLSNIFELVHQNAEELVKYENAYQEVLSVAKNRKSLQGGSFFINGWATKNVHMKEGFNKGIHLGILSQSEEFFKNNSDLRILINRISDFESVIRYKHGKFLSKELGAEAFMDYLNDLTNYSVSMFMLKGMLETKYEDGRSRYVKKAANEEDQKRYIRIETAAILQEKVDNFMNKLEKISDPTLLHMGKISTPRNLASCKGDLQRLPDLIGGEITPETFNPNEEIHFHKRKLLPGSIMWTWINSEPLRKGEWDSFFGFSDDSKRLPNMMRHLLDLNNEYLEVISRIERILKLNISYVRVEEEVLKIFSEKNNDNKFLSVQKKGEEAIRNIRAVLHKTSKYTIGRRNKTICLDYVGKVLGNNESRIDEESAKQLITGLDVLSCISVLMSSKMLIKPTLDKGKLERIIRNSFSKNKNHNRLLIDRDDKMWIMESEEEQKEREEAMDRNFSVFITATWISLGVFTTFFPLALPMVLTIVLIGALVANHISNG